MDGTLIDQTVAIVRCYEAVITGLGHGAPDPQAIRRSLGGPMASTMALFVMDAELDEACLQFRARFPKMMYEGLNILPGALHSMEYFASLDIPQAILTNKHGETARAVSQHCGFDAFVSVCLGNGDTEWSKPEAELSRTVLKQLKIEAPGAILIGDSPTDVATAQAIDIHCYAVATGAHSEAELQAVGAHASYPCLNTLLANLQA
jgi:phosphoglycolate phosphatase-like HAD superfamily hydrolase